MAYGQIDPARLNGDALTRWYLRSPKDVEQDRQAAATQRFNDFFSRPDDGAQAGIQPATNADETDGSGGPTLLWSAGDNAWRSDPGVESHQLPSASRPDAASTYQLAAASPRGFGDYWTIPGCANCHGYTPNTLPPIGGHFPSR